MENLGGKNRVSLLAPRDFEGGVVGLRIVAAMDQTLSLSPRSRPIPIVKNGARRVDLERDDGNRSVKKSVVGDWSASPVNLGGEVRSAVDFLSCCYLCNKQLHGLDIFMYRGEKAFCSGDCRDKHMRSDKRKEKCRSEAMNPLGYSVSPCSGQMLFFAGVAAA